MFDLQPYLFKTPQRLSQIFGINEKIYKRFGMKGHNGIDYVAPDGTELYPILIGRSQYEDQGGQGYGKNVRIFTDVGNGVVLETIYAHLQSVDVPNRKFTSWERIGLTGNTGFCLPKGKGWHVHFGIRVWKNGSVMNYDNGFYGWVDPALFPWEDYSEFFANKEKNAHDGTWEWGKSIGIVSDKSNRKGNPTLEEVVTVLNRYSKANGLK